MDPLEHQQRAMHHSISQPQIGPGQLPDESYIEKLFPKCQPKTSQVRGANQQFRNKRTLRAADRQQHYKRQNRAKQQQQQQPQQQNEAPRRNMTSRRPVKSTSDELIAFDKSRVPNSTTSHEIVSLTNSNHYCHSSDSTDKEKSVGRQNNAEPLKRSRSNQLMPQANAVAAAQYNKLRTRKYKASKNLQQQLKRSQSGYGKLFDSQPPPIDPSDRQTGPQKEKLQAAPQTDPANIGESAEGNRVNGMTTTKCNAKDDGTSRAADKGNRTNRGIVFAEPVAALLSAKAEAQPQQVSASTETKPLPLRSSNCIESESAPSVIEADGLAPAPGKSRQPAQVSAANKTAESKAPVRPQTESGEALLQVACAGIPNIHPSSCSSDEVRPLHFATDQTTSEQSCIESGICDTSANKVDNEDDDRFINLFVYDNASPQKRDEREVDKTTLITHKKHTETLATTSEQTLKATSQQLLGSDLSEDGLVSNDTSIEELCSFGDNDADDAGLKIRAQPRPTKRSSDHEFGGEAVNSDIAPATIGKSALKLHRSHSTLQTVDEKAEINIDDDDETLQDALEDARSKQADLSESTMIKKGLVPPGFVQRVRKPPVEVSATDSQISQSSPTRPAPISPPPNEQTRANPNAQSVDQLLPCLQPKEADEETRSVVERNLSEAMDKVSLDVDMPNLRQLKLPNEASHFSAVRSTLVDVQPTPRVEPQIDSRLQFNTLSDIESGADDDPNPHKAQSALKQQTELASMTRYASPGSSLMRAEEDSAPATRTALVFPCLDEGLSSEAESCDDEVDDDDDKAMEADVDADDDEDEDEDEDDEVEADNGPITKNLHSIQSSVDSFQQSLRPQNRLIGSLQQQATSGAQSRLPDLKSATTHAPHNDFTNSDALEQDDLKSNANYAARNGPANYWMGASQQAMSSQPSSSARLPHNNGNANLTRTNSYPNRDDVKTANRLSSDTDNETDRLLGTQRNDQLQKIANSELVSSNAIEQQAANNFAPKQGTNSREVLIEGVLFNVKYLGSTHTECEGRGEKEERIHQAELAVHEVKFRNGEAHLPVEVQLFISTEKIMVLDDKHRKIMMDHSLRTISYIADIGDAIVLIVRKKSASLDSSNDLGRPISKTSCHVFESNESHTITKSISQAFQVAYTELLKANGGGDGNNYLPKELDYQEVLNSQEMSMTELEMFARKDNQREVIVPKKAGEILGLSIVESGWGSVLPTAVIASLKPEGPAYRCKKLSIGDQILSINGISLVGLSLKECQKILRKTKKQSVARLSVVPCPITVEVKIKRPDTKYQLGFSVQHGVICSLLRGGIAERGGVRVGHRIISINGTTVVGVAHDKIVTLLASSVGEIRMKTCLTSLYRHMLGEEKNVSFV